MLTTCRQSSTTKRRDSLPGAILREQIELQKKKVCRCSKRSCLYFGRFINLFRRSGEVGSDNEEVTPTTTDNLPSSGDVNAKVVLLKARVKSLERLLIEKTTFGACL